MNVKAETGVMWPKAKQCSQLPKAGRGNEQTLR